MYKKIAIFLILVVISFLVLLLYTKVKPNNNYDSSILIVGDNMLSRKIGEDVIKGKDPYQFVRNDFGKYDLVVANLENVISDKGKSPLNKQFLLKAPVNAIYVIKNSGINVFSLANDHSMDNGSMGLTDMMKRLDKERINYFGGGKNTKEAFKYKIIENKGVKIAFLGFNEITTEFTKSASSSAGSTWNNMSKINNLIQSAKKEADIVLVMPHWGIQYKLIQNEKQIEEARSLIDSGADIIVGTHPHVIQGQEVYKGKNIFYSLGNFLFQGNNMDKITTRGYGLEIFIKDKKIISTNLRNVILNKKTGYPSFTK